MATMDHCHTMDDDEESTMRANALAWSQTNDGEPTTLSARLRWPILIAMVCVLSATVVALSLILDHAIAAKHAALQNVNPHTSVVAPASPRPLSSYPDLSAQPENALNRFINVLDAKNLLRYTDYPYDDGLNVCADIGYGTTIPDEVTVIFNNDSERGMTRDEAQQFVEAAMDAFCPIGSQT